MTVIAVLVSAIFIILFILMSLFQKTSLKKLYLYALSGLGMILLVFGLIRAMDTTLRFVVFQLPANGYHMDCEVDADESWQWRWRDEQMTFFDEPMKGESGKNEKPSDEEIEKFKEKLVANCKKRQATQRNNWAAQKFSEAISLIVIGGILWGVHFRLLRREEG